VAVGLVLATGCSTAPTPATVLVDYEHDEFATQFLRYFPDEVRARPGDTIQFRQTWTGEPHTVTFGTAVGPVLEVTRPLLAEYGELPYDQVPEDVLEQYMTAEMQLPHLYPMMEPEEGDEDAAGTPVELAQSVGQACVIADGEALPTDSTPCAERELGAFTGTEVLFNSGVIPYEGPSGNAFDLQLSDDISPGSYPFVCLVHGSFHSGVLEVVDEDEEVPSNRELGVLTRQEIEEGLEPLEDAFQTVVTEGRYERLGREFTGNFAGLVRSDMDGVVNEFLPREYDVAVGEEVTWKFFGPHSVSFDVPEYFPILEWRDDGTVTFNEELELPAGDAPSPEPPENPTEPWIIDGGTYDGDGFWSTGVLYSDAWVEYTLRFSEPGTYPFACLIHPPMVGVVRVRG
jgi:plastocyanin